MAQRDNRLCEYAVSQARREAAEQAEAQQKADRLAKAQAAKQEQPASLRHAPEESMAALHIAKTIDSASSEFEALLEPRMAMQKWQSLCDFGERLRRLGEGAPIPTLMQGVTGVQPIHGATFELVFEGNERDGHYDALSVRDGPRAPLRTVLPSSHPSTV